MKRAKPDRAYEYPGRPHERGEQLSLKDTRSNNDYTDIFNMPIKFFASLANKGENETVGILFFAGIKGRPSKPTGDLGNLSLIVSKGTRYRP